MHNAPLWLMKPTEPGRAMVVAKVALKPGKRAHNAQAIRADDADVGGLCFFEELALQFRALRADFLEAGGDDDGAAHPVFAAFPNDAGNGGRGG